MMLDDAVKYIYYNKNEESLTENPSTLMGSYGLGVTS